MTVTVYSTPTCAYCKVEKQWLTSKGIQYTSVDIEEDKEAAKYVEDVTGRMAVPVTIVNNNHGSSQVIMGFNRPQLTEALGL